MVVNLFHQYVFVEISYKKTRRYARLKFKFIKLHTLAVSRWGDDDQERTKMQLKQLLKRTLPSSSVLHWFLRSSNMAALTSGVKDWWKWWLMVMKSSRRSPLALLGSKHSVMSKVLWIRCSSYFRPWFFRNAITVLEEQYSLMESPQSSLWKVLHKVSQPPLATPC